MVPTHPYLQVSPGRFVSRSSIAMETYRNAKRKAKLKLVIDCDAGIDDAQAIMIALSQEVDILGITCTFGNVDVDQVIKNVFKVLEVCGRTDIPVYKGAYQPLLGKHSDLRLIAPP